MPSPTSTVEPAAELAAAASKPYPNDSAAYRAVGDDFARDYRGLAPDGNEWPALDVWVRHNECY